jgi:phage gpG-like protein
MIKFHIDDDDIKRALRNLQQVGSNLRPALRTIGETLKESTQKRFETTTAPDGSAWALNSVLSTLLHKEGDRPLTDGGILGDTINYHCWVMIVSLLATKKARSP